MSRLPSPGALVVSSGRQPPATTEREPTVDRHEDEEIDFLTIQEAAELLRIPVAPGDVGLPLVLRADRGEAARSAAGRRFDPAPGHKAPTWSTAGTWRSCGC
jgi:hypothetical protein